jgi:DNA-binding NtrC family response regulator
LDTSRVIRTLIVDDEELIRWSLHSALEGVGFDVELASRGDEALEMLTKSQYDIVITDYKIPGLNGLELLQKIRELGIRSIVIIISAYLSHTAIQQANEHGAFRCVCKPFGMEDFLDLVDEALQSGITNN